MHAFAVGMSSHACLAYWLLNLDSYKLTKHMQVLHTNYSRTPYIQILRTSSIQITHAHMRRLLAQWVTLRASDDPRGSDFVLASETPGGGMRTPGEGLRDGGSGARRARA
jgi:hypothetical protein